MEEIIARLEAILERIGQTDELSEDELEVLPLAWEEEVARLTEAAAAPTVKRNPALRARLEQLVARLPQVQQRIQSMRADVGAQLQGVNRNMQALRSNKADTGPSHARMLNRKV